MEPLIALVGVTIAVRAAGALGVRRFRSWTVALRGGVAAMFTLTGVAHFVGMRQELIAMVPPALPAAGLPSAAALVTITGLLELAGAAGLLLRPTARLAAGCLGVLLIVMFPSNVYAAVHGVATAPWDALLPRTLLQIVFVAATVAVVIGEARRTRKARVGEFRESRIRPDGSSPTPGLRMP
ncbi:DoxX family protein [Microlunatus soli]|uniref:Uncharacterized membrane protein n=1 Tax=Microlunatus soli TaxID=630515 RepID=A0A1H1MTJ2_9ACTN|nr:hypothetical protein [Microlunatus soli]SDR90020.1 Uncharacterized membrane protein [Microlunatus soli]